MRRLKLIGAFLCILAAWMQFLAPVAAMSMSAETAPFALICAKAKSTTANTADGGSQQTPSSHHDHAHCSLCQAYLGAAPLADRPAFTTLDYPVTSPLRWRHADLGIETSARHGVFQARAPPRLI